MLPKSGSAFSFDEDAIMQWHEWHYNAMGSSKLFSIGGSKFKGTGAFSAGRGAPVNQFYLVPFYRCRKQPNF